MSTEALKALKHGLETDDPALMQNLIVDSTTINCRGGCAIAYAGWKGHGLTTIYEVMDYYNDITGRSPYYPMKLFINWFDTTDRDEAFVYLLEEVNEELKCRNVSTSPDQ